MSSKNEIIQAAIQKIFSEQFNIKKDVDAIVVSKGLGITDLSNATEQQKITLIETLIDVYAYPTVSSGKAAIMRSELNSLFKIISGHARFSEQTIQGYGALDQAQSEKGLDIEKQKNSLSKDQVEETGKSDLRKASYSGRMLESFKSLVEKRYKPMAVKVRLKTISRETALETIMSELMGYMGVNIANMEKDQKKKTAHGDMLRIGLRPIMVEEDMEKACKEYVGLLSVMGENAQDKTDKLEAIVERISDGQLKHFNDTNQVLVRNLMNSLGIKKLKKDSKGYQLFQELISHHFGTLSLNYLSQVVDTEKIEEEDQILDRGIDMMMEYLKSHMGEEKAKNADLVFKNG